jgi:hypothetical protein
MHRRQQRCVGADQRRVFERKTLAVRVAGLGDSLVGQVHRSGPVRGGAPDRLLWLSV